MDPFAPRESRRRAGARRSRTATGAQAVGRSKSWILLALTALLIIGYVFFVVLIGGGQAGTAEGGAPSGQRAVADPGGGREGRGAADQNRPGDGQGNSEDLPLTAPGDDDRGESNPEGHDDHDHDVYVYEPEGSDEGPGPNGAEGEPGGYDPLGKGTDGPVLSETQLERAELAVSNYVTAVYGYSGDDFNEYQKKVGEAVVFPGFFSSPGAEHVREVQRQIEGTPDGVTSGSVLKGFTAEQQTEERIEGVAYFDVGEGVAFSKTAASGVELQGEVNSYAQPVNLQLYGSQWRVTEAGQRQEVTD